MGGVTLVEEPSTKKNRKRKEDASCLFLMLVSSFTRLLRSFLVYALRTGW